MSQQHDAIQFVEQLFLPAEIVEARCIRPQPDKQPPVVKSFWFPAQLINEQLATLQRLNQEGFNIFVGVNPRPTRGATGDDSITFARMVFADFDDADADAAIKTIADVGLPHPYIVINSGHGTHCYWLMNKACTDLKAWKELQRDLADLLGSDRKVQNPERIMRLPGFANVKGEPVPCRITKIEHDVIDFAEFRDRVPRPAPPPTPTHRSNGNGHDRDVDDAMRIKRAGAYIDKMPSAISGQDGHGKTFAVACETQRFGLSDSDAWTELVRFNGRCDPPWNEQDLQHKFNEAKRICSGDFGSRLAEEKPARTARKRNPRQAPSAAAEVASNPPADNPENHGGDAADVVQHDGDDVPADAGQYGDFADAGNGHDVQAAPVLDPANPRATARKLLASHYLHSDVPTLIFDGGSFAHWVGGEGRYVTVALQAVREQVYQFLESAKKIVKIGDNESTQPFKPNKATVDNVIDAIRAGTYTAALPPCWLNDTTKRPPVNELLIARNGIFRIASDGLQRYSDLTPNLYSHNALDYEISPRADAPARWLWFLKQLWPDDQQSIDMLQEWFGYCLMADTTQQKILLMIGPKRAGKGTIARVLKYLIGAENFTAPTLSGLTTNFGLWSLIDRSLAVISDARLSGRTDQAVVVERLLAISGEDAITIDRKNQQPITTTLSTRFMILTNELPKLNDASCALANRFITLQLTKTFLNQEITTLTDELLAELPGIFLWAVQGLGRLRKRGRFVQPAASETLIEQLEDLASPVGAFVREYCSLDPEHQIEVQQLFDGWQAWCQEQHHFPGNRQVFARDLRSAVSAIGTTRPTVGGERVRMFTGIELTLVAQTATEVWKSTYKEKRNQDEVYA